MKTKRNPVQKLLRLILLLGLLLYPVLGIYPAAAQDGAPTPPPLDDALAPPAEETAPVELPPNLYEALQADGALLAQVDPFAPQKLYSGGAPGDALGFSVALDEAGDTAIVGAYGTDGVHDDQGAAYIYDYDGKSWNQTVKLRASDPQAGARFGISVAISADGETVLVGADLHDDLPIVDEGGADIYRKLDNGVWSSPTSLEHNDPPDARFGWSVDLSSDGQYAIVGAYNASIGLAGSQDGTASIYVRNGALWELQKTLIRSQDGELMGYSVALDGNGDVAVLGMPGYNGMGAESGGVALFTRSGATWSFSRAIHSHETLPGDWLGRSVAVDNPGTTILAGASRTDVGGRVDQGAAYVFIQGSGSWPQQARLLPDTSGAAGDNFGVSVSLSATGSQAVVGALDGGSSTRPNAGSAFVYSRSGTTWTGPAAYALCDTNGDRCGVGVALSGNGAHLLVGADRDDYAGITDSGLVWVLDMTISPTSFQVNNILLGSGDSMDDFGAAIAVSDDGSTLLVGAPGAEAQGFINRGAAWVFVRSGSMWRLQARLEGVINEAETNFGGSVALSADGNTALIGEYLANDGVTNAGAAYLFVRSGETWTLQHLIKADTRQAHDHFGYSVALSDDGQWVAIGARWMDYGGETDAGAVYIRQRDGLGWESPDWVGQGGPNAEFGSSVAFSGNGYYVLAGAPGVSLDRGAAYVFKQQGGTDWTLGGTLLPSDGANGDEFGHSVAITDNGVTALVGAPYRNVGSHPDIGQAYAYARTGDTWAQLDILTYPYPSAEKADDLFGAAVSLDASGGWGLVSAPYASGADTETGLVMPFIRHDLTFDERASLVDASGRSYERMGNDLAQTDDGLLLFFGMSNGYHGQTRSGAVYVLPARYRYEFLYLPFARK